MRNYIRNILFVFSYIDIGYECIVFSGIAGINVLLLFDILKETDLIIGQGINEFMVDQGSISRLSPALPCDRILHDKKS